MSGLLNVATGTDSNNSEWMVRLSDPMCDGICLFCGKGLQTYERPRRSTCSVCGEEFEPSAACPDGHHVCDGCLRERGISVMTAVCKTTDCRDPAEILDRLMSIPAIPMHGPAHHILVGSALLAAYRNNGGKTDLDASIPELIRRMSQVPGAVCGNWGCCGAALSAGTFASIVLGSGPLEKDVWRIPMRMTASCLERISSYGGPRCCKRDSFLAIEAAADLIKKETGVAIDIRKRIVCGRSGMNQQCIGKACPYNGKTACDIPPILPL